MRSKPVSLVVTNELCQYFTVYVNQHRAVLCWTAQDIFPTEERMPMTPTPSPTHLRVEHLDAPLGISAERPRFSWWLPEGAVRQQAYQLVVGEWDSGRVESEQ